MKKTPIVLTLVAGLFLGGCSFAGCSTDSNCSCPACSVTPTPSSSSSSESSSEKGSSSSEAETSSTPSTSEGTSVPTSSEPSSSEPSSSSSSSSSSASSDQPVYFKVTFVNADGTELYSTQVKQGEDATYGGVTPTKADDSQYHYTFSNWDKGLTNIQGDVTLTAQYSATTRGYLITFLNEDGTSLQASDFSYGATPVYSGATPTKDSDVQYDYTFDAWDRPLAAVTGTATYKATYKTSVRSYLITFLGDNGVILQSSSFAYGETPTYTANTPTKAATAGLTYTFDDWDKAIVPVKGMATYTAKFKSVTNQYVVTFKNYDGTKILQEQTLDYGATPAYSGTASLAKPEDAQYTYTFSGWSPELSSVTGDVTYTATYSHALRQYEVSFLNEDGTLLEKQTLDYGDTPVYQGSKPTKAGNVQYSYAFLDWDSPISAVTGAKTYTATFQQEVNQYTVRFLDDDGTVLQTNTVDYGSSVQLAISTPHPYRAPTATSAYAWNGLWDSSLTPVTGDKDYKPTFTEYPYTINYTYDSTTSSYTISGHSDDLRGIIIPDEYDDGTNGRAPVKGMVTNAFSNQSKLIEVTLPSTMTYFGSWTFSDDTSLSKLHYANGSATEFTGDHIFGRCYRLTAFTLPEGLTAIPKDFLADSFGLKTIAIPSGVTSIGENAFYNCSAMTGITYASSGLLSSIGEKAFYNSGLVSFQMPAGVTSIGQNAFMNSLSLKEVTFETNPTALIGNALYNGCTALTSFTIPSTVLTVNESYFSGSGLTQIAIPSRVTSIGSSAFASCSALTGVDFSKATSLKTLGDDVFKDDTALTEITLPANLTSVGDNLLNNDSGITSLSYSTGAKILTGRWILQNTSTTSFTIPSTVTTIDSYYFANSAITSISIPSSVKAINDHAFAGMSNLTSIDFSHATALTTIGDNFENDTALTVTLPANLTNVGDNLFDNDTALTSISYATGTKALKGRWILQNTGVTSFTIPDTVTLIDSYYFASSKLTSIALPDQIVNINDRAFAGMSKLTSVDFSNATALTTIGDNAFENDTALTTAVLPAGLATVGDNLFDNDTALTSLTYAAGTKALKGRWILQSTGVTSFTIPSTVTLIESYYFASSKLTSVALPDQIVRIDNHAFAGMSKLTSVDFSNATALTTIGDNLFEKDTALTTAVLPANLTSVGDDLFSSCAALTSVSYATGVKLLYGCRILQSTGVTTFTIPSTVTNIGANYFEGANISSLTLPSSVINIGSNAFANNSSLTTLNYNGTKAEWLKITLNEDWHANSSLTTVLTSDYSYDIASNTWTAR